MPLPASTPRSLATPPIDSALLDQLRDFAESLGDAARALFAPHLRGAPGVQLKVDRTLVTALDRAIEVYLRGMIEARFPEHGLYGEEEGSARLEADFVWVLDPIDGTAPFIAGVPVFGTLIALLHHGKPVLGLMDFPVTQERWVGVQGQPTVHQNAPCRVRACSNLADAMLTTSNPDFFPANELPVLAALRERTRWRIYGGCCYAYGLLALGRTDVAIDTRFKFWDYAPFVPIIEGAGGVITDWRGQPLHLSNCPPQVLAAGDPARHAEALALVQQHWGA